MRRGPASVASAADRSPSPPAVPLPQSCDAGSESRSAGRTRPAQGLSRRAGAGRRRHRRPPRRDSRPARPQRVGEVHVHQPGQRALPARWRRITLRRARSRASRRAPGLPAAALRARTRSRVPLRISRSATMSRWRRCSAAPTCRATAARREAQRWLEFTGLAARAAALPDDLNLHQRKFLEFARALAARPRLVLLDEVLSGLTPTEINGAVDMIRAIRDQGATIVFVEHVMRAVIGLADRIVVLDHGQVIAEGARRRRHGAHRSRHRVSRDPPCLGSTPSRRNTARRRRFGMFRSRCAPASSSASSGPTAPASRRSST